MNFLKVAIERSCNFFFSSEFHRFLSRETRRSHFAGISHSRYFLEETLLFWKISSRKWTVANVRCICIRVHYQTLVRIELRVARVCLTARVDWPRSNFCYVNHRWCFITYALTMLSPTTEEIFLNSLEKRCMRREVFIFSVFRLTRRMQKYRRELNFFLSLYKYTHSALDSKRC